MDFRRSLAASFLFRFVVEVALRLRKEAPEAGGWLPAGAESAAARFERPPSRGIQYFSKAGDADVVGQPERHMAADLQVPICLAMLFRHLNWLKGLFLAAMLLQTWFQTSSCRVMLIFLG